MKKLFYKLFSKAERARLKQAQNMSGSVLLTTEASQLSVGIAGKQHCINIEDSLMIVKKVQQIDKFT